MFVGFTKYDDIAAKASNSIQESDLKSICDFLDSVDLRYVCVCLYSIHMLTYVCFNIRLYMCM